MADRYEHVVETFGNAEVELHDKAAQRLDALSADGWEVVAFGVATEPATYYALLRRVLPGRADIVV